MEKGGKMVISEFHVLPVNIDSITSLKTKTTQMVNNFIDKGEKGQVQFK